MFIVSQLLAAFAFVIGLIAVQFKSRKSVLVVLSLSTIINAAHFFALDRPAAAGLLFLTTVRYLIATKTTHRGWLYAFLVLSVICFPLTFKSYLSLLALCGVLFGTYGSFEPTDQRLRIYLMIGNSLWLVHNVLSGTPVASIMEACFLCSNLIGYYRYYIAKSQFRANQH